MNARRRHWDELGPAEKVDVWRRLSQARQLQLWPDLCEEDRLAMIRAGGRAPDACGSDIAIAPARPGLVAFMPMGTVIDAQGETKTVGMGYRGRHAARRSDAFDRMERAPRAKDQTGPIFDATQVRTGRDYAALHERVAAGAVRGASMEARTDGSGGDADSFIQARLDDRARLKAMQRRIGDGVALEVRRLRPSARGDGAPQRRGIPDRRLVDIVCLEDRTIDQVLEAFHWKKDMRVRNALRAALAAALDRMAKRA